jgi:acetaldehyde dehydrogenase
MKVAVIGTGNIGTDLLIKLKRLDFVDVVAFVGRRPLTKSIPPGVNYFKNGIEFFREHPRACDIVFDCTDAYSATENAKVFFDQGITVIDMTPSKVGQFCVPNVNCGCLKDVRNINMVTCGGQVSIPLLSYITSKCTVEYAEVVTQISSESAGMATRINIDKYIETTEKAITSLTPIQKCKVILNINPHPEIHMQTTLLLKTSHGDFSDFPKFVQQMKTYVPNYEVVCVPKFTNGILIVSVKVVGLGDYISEYSGNLDIINCAAIEILKKLHGLSSAKPELTNCYNSVLDI